MRIDLCLIILLLTASPILARSPLIGDFVNVETPSGYYQGQVESCDLGFLCLNCTYFREVMQADGSQSTLIDDFGHDVCIGIGQIEYLSYNSEA